MMKTFLCSCVLYCLVVLSCNEPREKADEQVVKTSSTKELMALLQKYPDSILIAEDLAARYETQENYAAAIDVLQNQVKRDSTNGRLYEAIGFLYYEVDDTTNAIRYYKQARNYSADAKILVALGTLQAGRGNAEAKLIATLLLQNDSVGNGKEAYYMQGVYYSRTNKAAEALFYFDKSLQISYTFTNAYLEKAALQAKINDYKGAITTLNRGIAVQNNFPDGYYAKGLYLQQLGDYNAALDAYNKALLYDPNFTEAILAKQNLQKQHP